MKFSIIIPTQDRPDLVAVAVHYALNQRYKNIEVVVSDNSTSEEMKTKTAQKLDKYVKAKEVLLVSPPTELSAPEHFEFALKYATGDYVLFLTDKMMLLSDTLDSVAKAINKSGAEIVNWTYYSFVTDDYLNPAGLGTLINFSSKPFNVGYKEYDPLKHLKNKAAGITSRGKESPESYVKGKLCFGCYSKGLITRIENKSGALYGGATHDYSAMVQALCATTKSIILNEPGILFITIPSDKSWGPLTYYQSSYALKYYRKFANSDAVLSSLFVPNLYSSQHNMVASDYIKYLTLYGKRKLFADWFWLISIENDLKLPDKVWASDIEKEAQHRIFSDYITVKVSLFDKVLIGCIKRYSEYSRRICNKFSNKIKGMTHYCKTYYKHLSKQKNVLLYIVKRLIRHTINLFQVVIRKVQHIEPVKTDGETIEIKKQLNPNYISLNEAVERINSPR